MGNWELRTKFSFFQSSQESFLTSKYKIIFAHSFKKTIGAFFTMILRNLMNLYGFWASSSENLWIHLVVEVSIFLRNCKHSYGFWASSSETLWILMVLIIILTNPMNSYGFLHMIPETIGQMSTACHCCAQEIRAEVDQGSTYLTSRIFGWTSSRPARTSHQHCPTPSSC